MLSIKPRFKMKLGTLDTANRLYVAILGNKSGPTKKVCLVNSKANMNHAVMTAMKM